FGRAAAVVRNGRGVGDGTHFETRVLHGADRGFATRAGSGYLHVHFADALFHRLTRGVLGGDACGERRAFARTAKAACARAALCQHITLWVGDGNECVVEGRVDRRNTDWNIFLFFAPPRGTTPGRLFLVSHISPSNLRGFSRRFAAHKPRRFSITYFFALDFLRPA